MSLISTISKRSRTLSAAVMVLVVHSCAIDDPLPLTEPSPTVETVRSPELSATEFGGAPKPEFIESTVVGPEELSSLNNLGWEFDAGIGEFSGNSPIGFLLSALTEAGLMAWPDRMVGPHFHRGDVRILLGMNGEQKVVALLEQPPSDLVADSSSVSYTHIAADGTDLEAIHIHGRSPGWGFEHRLAFNCGAIGTVQLESPSAFRALEQVATAIARNIDCQKMSGHPDLPEWLSETDRQVAAHLQERGWPFLVFEDPAMRSRFESLPAMFAIQLPDVQAWLKVVPWDSPVASEPPGSLGYQSPLLDTEFWDLVEDDQGTLAYRDGRTVGSGLSCDTHEISILYGPNADLPPISEMVETIRNNLEC